VKRLLLCALLAGCASARYPEPPADETWRELQAAKRQLAQSEQELAAAKAEGRPVDCARATKLGDNVCMLSERICTLVQRLPPENAAQCTDARARCAAAREKVKAACPKPPG
jgi:hypothetical protein